jgi:hypothetical protein
MRNEKTQKKNEIWADIPGYQGVYQASNLGRIKRLAQEYVLSPITAPCGYDVVNLSIKGARKTQYVHKLIYQAFNPEYVTDRLSAVLDHINSNKGDNRLDNLRSVTQRENCSKLSERTNKTSKYIGVHLNKSGKWIGQIKIDGDLLYLGSYNTEEEAAEAYKKALTRYVR